MLSELVARFSGVWTSRAPGVASEFQPRKRADKGSPLSLSFEMWNVFTSCKFMHRLARFIVSSRVSPNFHTLHTTPVPPGPARVPLKCYVFSVAFAP